MIKKNTRKLTIQPGEDVMEYINRVYRNVIVQAHTTTALLEQTIFDARDMLLEDTAFNTHDDDLEWMMRYFDSFCKRIDNIFKFDDDVMLDFRYKAQELAKSKLNKLLLAISIQCNENGVENPRLASKLIAIQVLTDTIRDLWKISVEQIGKYKSVLPNYINKAMFFLPYIANRANNLLERSAPELASVSMRANKDVEDALMEIVNDVFSGDLASTAFEYSFTENNIETK